MQNSDKAIDRVLTGLRNTQAPEGLTQRIHQSLQANASKKTGWRSAWLFMPSPMRQFVFWPVAVAGVAIIATTIYWTVRQTPEKQRDRVEVSRPAIPSPQSPEQAVHVRSSQPAAVVITKAIPLNQKRLQQSTYIEPRKTYAENHPATEAPLTNEEKLLIRLAHQANPQLIAAYAPMLRAASDEEEKAAFDKFFDPPKAPAEDNE